MDNAIQLPLTLDFLFTAQTKSIQSFIETNIAKHRLTAMDGGNADNAGAVISRQQTFYDCNSVSPCRYPRGVSSNR